MPTKSNDWRSKLKDDDFALPSKKAFPIRNTPDDKLHVRLAKQQLKRRKGLTAEERKTALEAIVARATELKMDTSKWEGVATDAADVEVPEEITISAINVEADPEALLAMWLCVHQDPYSSVERAALLAAIYARCETLGVSSYSWDVYGAGKALKLAQAMAAADPDPGALDDAANASGKGDTENAADDREWTAEEVVEIKEIGALKAYWQASRDAEMTAPERDGLEAAVRSQCETLGYSFWSWKPVGQMDAADCLAFALDSAGGVTLDAVLAPAEVIADEAGKPLRARFVLMQVNGRNINTRCYPEQKVDEQLARVNQLIADGALDNGEVPHPEAYKAPDGTVAFLSDFNKHALKWEKAYRKGRLVYGDAVVLEHTPAGKLIAGHVRAKAKVGISTRATGTMEPRALADGTQVLIPGADWTIRTWDAVPNPADNAARSVQLLDSAQVEQLMTVPIQPPSAGEPPAGAASQLPATAADSTKEDDGTMPEDIRKLIEAKDPVVLGALKDAAAEILTEQKNADTAAQKAAAERQQAITAVVDAADLTRYPEKVQAGIRTAVAVASTPEQAKAILDSQMTVADEMLNQAKLAGLGLGTYGANDGGTVSVRVDELARQGWMQHVDKILAANDEILAEKGVPVDQKLREVNKKQIQRLMAKFVENNPRMFADAATQFDAINDSTTTAQVLTQPTILAAMITQAFQDAEGLQIAFLEPAEGTLYRIMSEYVVPGTDQSNGDILGVEDGTGMELQIASTWLEYGIDIRDIQIRITDFLQHGALTGPGRYNTISRGLYHLTQAQRRAISLGIYNEALLASDEYGAVAVNAETVATGNCKAPATGWYNQYAGGNIAYVAKLICEGNAGTPGNKPVLPPRVTKTMNNIGQLSSTTVHDTTVTVGGSTLVRGSFAQNAAGVYNISGTNATYAVDWENGLLLFTSGSGVNTAAATPVLPSAGYTYATNVDVFDMSGYAGATDQAAFLDKLLAQIDSTAGLMGSAPRYEAPNIVLMSKQRAPNVKNARTFWKQASPGDSRLVDTGNNFAVRYNLNFLELNDPWRAGNGRMLLGQRGAVRYGVSKPWSVEGPIQAYNFDQTTNTVKAASAKVFHGQEYSKIAVPQVTDQNGNVINPKFRSVRLING